MQEQTRELILSAWRENRLAALHVDAQWIFSDNVFPVIGTLAEGLRERNVANIWAAWPDYERRIPTGITNVEDYHQTNQDEDYYLSRHVGALDGETMMVKNTQSCFGTLDPHLETYLDARNIDTLIVTGVGGRACVEKTLRQGILMDKYNLVAATDAINKTGDDYLSHIQGITGKNPAAFERRYHQSTTPQILNALRPDASGP